LVRRLVLAVGVLAALAVSAGPASAATFTNSSPITINDGTCGLVQARASAYPSNITVSGLTGTVTDVNVTLTDFSHTLPSDIRVLLVGPGGQTALLMQAAGGALDAAGVTFTLDDEAAGSIPAPIVPGSYKPTQNAHGCAASASLPGPAPADPYGATLGGFDGTAPNGTWSLYVVDINFGDTGAFAGGWSLDITTSAPAASVTRTVDDDLAQCPAAGYQTIHAALDAAGPGDTINVCRGTYTGEHVVDVDDVDIVSSTALAAAVVNAPNSNAFYIASGTQGVSVRRFKIVGTPGNSAGFVGNEGASYELIKDNVISGFREGVELLGGATGTLVRDNLISGYTADGIGLDDEGTSIDARNNTLVGGPGTRGISFGPSTQGLAFGNAVSKNGDVGIYLAGDGQTAKGNTVSQGGLGIWADFGTGRVENNNVSANSGNGIQANAGGYTFLSNNAKGNTGTDCLDLTTGSGTAGTANTWTGNYGLESNPAGICKK
jgi:subtilisin-like proprotein convertase family protein